MATVTQIVREPIKAVVRCAIVVMSYVSVVVPVTFNATQVLWFAAHQTIIMIAAKARRK